jgi:hypothetical protein
MTSHLPVLAAVGRSPPREFRVGAFLDSVPLTCALLVAQPSKDTQIAQAILQPQAP